MQISNNRLSIQLNDSSSSDASESFFTRSNPLVADVDTGSRIEKKIDGKVCVIQQLQAKIKHNKTKV